MFSTQIIVLANILNFSVQSYSHNFHGCKKHECCNVGIFPYTETSTYLRIIKHPKKSPKGNKEKKIPPPPRATEIITYQVLYDPFSLLLLNPFLHKGIQSFSLESISSFSPQSSPFSPLQYIVLENQDRQQTSPQLPSAEPINGTFDSLILILNQVLTQLPP